VLNTPIYALDKFDPANIGYSTDERPLGHHTKASLQFPKPIRGAKADLLIARPREPMPPTSSLFAAARPAREPGALKTDYLSRFLPASPTLAVLNTPTLAPLAFVHFCGRYPEDCEINSNDRTPLSLTQAKLAELAKINREVNNSIVPQVNREGVSA